MSEKEIIARSERAEKLLNDPELLKAFDTVRENLLDRFQSISVKDREEAHEIKLMLTLLAAVKANLQSVVDSGKVIIHRNSMLDRAKRGINAFRN